MVAWGWGLLLLVVVMWEKSSFGKEGSTLARTTMNKNLKVEMAFSAAFVRWIYLEWQSEISFLVLRNGVFVLPNIHCTISAHLEWNPYRWGSPADLFARRGCSTGHVILMALPVLHLYRCHARPWHICFFFCKWWGKPLSDMKLLFP